MKRRYISPLNIPSIYLLRTKSKKSAVFISAPLYIIRHLASYHMNCLEGFDVFLAWVWVWWSWFELFLFDIMKVTYFTNLIPLSKRPLETTSAHIRFLYSDQPLQREEKANHCDHTLSVSLKVWNFISATYVLSSHIQTSTSPDYLVLFILTPHMAE